MAGKFIWSGLARGKFFKRGACSGRVLPDFFFFFFFLSRGKLEMPVCGCVLFLQREKVEALLKCKGIRFRGFFQSLNQLLIFRCYIYAYLYTLTKGIIIISSRIVYPINV